MIKEIQNEIDAKKIAIKVGAFGKQIQLGGRELIVVVFRKEDNSTESIQGEAHEILDKAKELFNTITCN